MILTDTSILIDYLKKKSSAIDFINKYGKNNLAINTVIAMELFQGARNSTEFIRINKELEGFYMLPITLPISRLALQLAKRYALSHHIGLSDTFIAGTALIYDIELRTFNIKDFHFIPGIKVSNSLF